MRVLLAPEVRDGVHATRIQVVGADGWAVVHRLALTAQPRYHHEDDGRTVIKDERSRRLVAINVGVDSLPTSGHGQPMLSRLRMLHSRVTNDKSWCGLESQWTLLAGRDGELAALEGEGDRHHASSMSPTPQNRP